MDANTATAGLPAAGERLVGVSEAFRTEPADGYAESDHGRVADLGVDETMTQTLTSYVSRQRVATAPSVDGVGVVRTLFEDTLPPRLAPRRAVSRLRLDIGALVVAAVVTLSWNGRYGASPILWQALFALLAIALLAGRDAYAPRLRRELIEDVRTILAATAVSAMAILTFEYVLASRLVSTTLLIREWAVAAFCLFAAHALLKLDTLYLVRSGQSGSPTLIVGAGNVGQRIATRLLAQPTMGLTPVGFLDKEPLEGRGLDLPVLGASWDLEDVIRTHGVERVVITFSTAPTSVVLDIVRRCERLGVIVSSVPRLFESVNGRLTVDYSGAIPLVTRRPVDPHGWPFLLKDAADRVFALLLLIVLFPLFVILAFCVWCSVGSPILFRQVRVGRDGREFKMFKFRSMRGWCEDIPEEAPTATDDIAPGGVEGVDRRTRLGTFLRQNSLDELPQLLNVIAGDMSLVGPRPERPDYVERFERRVYRYGDRHRVKVGITGWAQIHGLRGKTSLEDRVEWDNYYIENWTPWLDIKILVLTVSALLHGGE